MRRTLFGTAIIAVLVIGTPVAARAQTAESHYDHLVRIASSYQVSLDVVYRTANNWEAKLDIIRPRQSSTPTQTVLFFHGGCWTGGSKDAGLLAALPYAEMGYAVVNVAYRLADVSLAPAAVEDARCALRWIYRNAKQYNFDVNRLVLTGQSAGGHLALITGMLTEDAGLDL
jgi:acetyl esterase/lipase